VRRRPRLCATSRRGTHVKQTHRDRVWAVPWKNIALARHRRSKRTPSTPDRSVTGTAAAGHRVSEQCCHVPPGYDTSGCLCR
jgi:hypothetical protein